jgi:hypothetical protein
MKLQATAPKKSIPKFASNASPSLLRIELSVKILSSGQRTSL